MYPRILQLPITPSYWPNAAPAITTEESKESIQGNLGTAAGILGQDAIFDYVIIGGGTAGLVMANRLSANPNITVAVVEAGAFYQITNPLLSETPAGDVVFVGADPKDSNPLLDWDSVTEPQAGANSREIYYAHGKRLGGSSARNFMIYQRGTEQNYNKWADAVGDDGYKWDALRPHFKRSLTFTLPSTAFSTPGSPLQVSYASCAQPFSTWIEPSLNEIGVPLIQDFNSGKLLGAHQTSFLNEAFGRPNLKVYITTLAKKNPFDSNEHATGVIHNIPIIADRPGVGQTMEDHQVNLQIITQKYAINYTIFKRGPLISPAKTPRNLLTPKTNQILNKTFPHNWPEMEYLVAPVYDGYQYAIMMGALVAPLSRGNVTLRSADAKDLPLMNPNWLTREADIDVAVAIYKPLRAAFASIAMKYILLGREEYFPGPDSTDQPIEERIRQTGTQYGHSGGTAPMGKVVDTEGRVIGVRGLRFADATTLYAPAEQISGFFVDRQ
ncbi:hypothetical protein V8F06_012086 [Rhypophila decipiens]